MRPRYRVLAEVFNARQTGLNSAIQLRKGQIVPDEIIEKYTDAQISAHVEQRRIEVVDGGPQILQIENKKAPNAQLKGAKNG